MKATRLKSSAVLLAVAFLLLPGCGRSKPPVRTRPLIGVSLLTQTHAFYKELEDAMRREAANRKFDLIVTACEMDPAKQAAQIEDFVAQKVDALVVAPCDSSAIVPHLRGPEAAGIPVFTVDIAAHGAKIVSHVASDNLAGGGLAAQTLAALLGGQGDVIIIDHPEVASVQDRTQGFEDEIRKVPGIHVVGRPSASGQRAKAMAVMEDMLQAHKNLKGVFAINDDSALGALAVLNAAHRQDVVIVGFDATAEAQAAIRLRGALKADIAQHPTQIGTTTIATVARYLAGEKVPATVAVEVSVIDAAALAAPPGSAKSGR
jgi:ribose transport system substrate-binding protein